MSETVIAVQGLTKDYGGGRGVFELDFAVEQGEVFGFLGPNGAGKTTTLRQLMGFIRPTGGVPRFLEWTAFRRRRPFRRKWDTCPASWP